jgi:4-hydroxythreonine-4-phosphate dehydrogenase
MAHEHPPELTQQPTCLALTMGDPCGIGPEIVAAQWLQPVPPNAFVVGDPAVMARAMEALAQVHPEAVNLRVSHHQGALPSAEAVRQWVNSAQRGASSASSGVIVVPVWSPPDLPEGLVSLPWGAVNARAGQAAAVCVRAAAQAVLAGLAAAMVTAPLHKEALSAAGEPFPGHTELLQALATPHGQPLVPLRMMLANHELKTVLVSIHVSLRQALEAVTVANVLQTIEITHQSLVRMGVAQPRIAVAGLNPHAGEGGLFGSEEIDTIVPAIAAARAKGIDATGPHAPDTVFMRARHAPDHGGEFDVVVAMYHDQGLIPVKYLGVAHGVNVTLGLPLVRTSPDHGTAFDLAGKGVADPSSMAEAMAVAQQLAGFWPAQPCK